MQKRNLHLFSGILILLAVVFGVSNVKAQNATDFRLNEILVINESNYQDDFGQHSSWIEIFNSSYSPVNLGGCFLTDDLNNPTKYWIPTGDPATQISPRCYVVFWADNKPARGIFHLNFTIEEGKTIALFDANGRTMIDKIQIPANQVADITYGRVNNDSDKWAQLDKTTPGANNDYSRRASSGEKFVEMDPSGLGMTLIAMIVVFSALAILYIIYNTIGSFFIRKARVAANKQESEVVKTSVAKTSSKEELSGEVNAAIAMALYMYQNEMHDFENTVLTINKVSRTYSPWSSKIYTLRKSPR